MSRKANCYDNAVKENFFGHLKEELFHRVRFINTEALASALHECIHWYNTERISIKLKGLSPVQPPCPRARGLRAKLPASTD
jgi:putative transposase